jgi:predicted  nucleic acid-binding Zn-ribbon protein
MYKEQEEDLKIVIDLFKKNHEDEAQLQLRRYFARQEIKAAEKTSMICSHYDKKIERLSNLLDENQRLINDLDKKNFALGQARMSDHANFLQSKTALVKSNAKLREEIKRLSSAGPEKTKVIKKEKRKPGRTRKEVKTFSSNISATVANAHKELQNV